jgi:hypothetical protein
VELPIGEDFNGATDDLHASCQRMSDGTSPVVWG